MNLNVGLQVGAWFKFMVHKGDGVPTQETGWIKNLVLNAGLDRMSVGGADDTLFIGSGNSEPNVNQTSLDVQRTSTTNKIAHVTGRQLSEAPIYHWSRRTYRFNEGQASGNMAEVGLGWGSNNLFNRALIKDAQGQPTTITVLADDFLDVIVELRVYPTPLTESSFNVVNKLGDIVSSHTVKIAPLMASNPTGAGIGSALMGKVILGTPSDSGHLRMFTGAANLDKPSTDPSGYFGTTNVAANTYPTPRSCQGRMRMELGNIANGKELRSMDIGISYLGQWQSGSGLGYKVEIDPPFIKKPTQVVDIKMTVSWDRYSEV